MGDFDLVPRHRFEVWIVSGSKTLPKTLKIAVAANSVADISTLNRRSLERSGVSESYKVFYSAFVGSLSRTGQLQPPPVEVRNLSEPLLKRMGRLFPEARDIRLSYLGKYGKFSLTEIVPKEIPLRGSHSFRKIYAVTRVETVAFDAGETNFRRIQQSSDGTTLQRRPALDLPVGELDFVPPTEWQGHFILASLLLPDRSSPPRLREQLWPKLEKAMADAVRAIREGTYEDRIIRGRRI
jgi:hypothetical protein